MAGTRNLEPVLAGIARAADPQRPAVPVERAALHEAELADAGDDGLKHFGRLRPLQREQRLLLHMVDDHAGAAAAARMTAMSPCLVAPLTTT